MPGCRLQGGGNSSRKNIILLRPEDMQIVKNSASQIEAVLCSVELTGYQTIVTAKLGETELTVRKLGDSPIVENTLQFWITLFYLK